MSHAPTATAVAAGNTGDKLVPAITQPTRQDSHNLGGGAAARDETLVGTAREALDGRVLPAELPCELTCPDGTTVYLEKAHAGHIPPHFFPVVMLSRDGRGAGVIAHDNLTGALVVVVATSLTVKCLGALPEAQPVFAELSAKCAGPQGESGTRWVVLRFASAEQLELAGSNNFVRTITSFNMGLPEGWCAEELPELVRKIKTPPEQFVDFKSD